TLSGGEKQRLAIAAALAMAGKILILDEPLSRLDPEGAEELLRVIKDVRKKRTLTVIMAAHESKKVLRFADRICVLKNGRIAACDTPQKIFEDRALPESNGIQPPVEPDISAFFVPQEREMKTEENAAINISDFSYFYANSNISSVKINLSIADNDFAAIIGRNGCGKTTLLKNIAGLLRPSTGAIYIRGKNSDGLSISAISKEVGFVMQNPDSQLFTGTVYDEVSFALKNYRLPKEEIRRRTEAALRTVGLENWDAFPHAMNRGDRTKTVIASVLAMGCRIILLDEPDVGQDYRGSREIMEILRKLRTEGNTLVFVTHNISLACEYAQRLIIMDKSGIVNMRRRSAV
ncbi:MAG: ATP-binding cassette domain-containing protein, partial [Treponema sp.]|nr:ATP-binding cassette domain-containing protein [Treponema sp.]